MSDTISAMKLVGDSRRFVFSNLEILKEHLKVIFPLVLLLELANSMGKAMQADWIALVTAIPVLYLYACFALSWHRTSLMGPSSSHAINPLQWESRNKGFILLFFALVFVPFVTALLIGFVIGGVATTQNNVLIGIAVVFGLAASIFMFIQLIRVSFMMPAKSMDVTLTIAEARKTSKGLVSKILISGFIIGLAFMGALMLYGFVVALTVAMIASGTEPSTLMTGLITFFFAVPVNAAAFIVTAINITVLSRAYQWGMQNNA